MTQYDNFPDDLNLLAIDSACNACSVGIWRGARNGLGRILAERSASMARGHAEALIPMTQEVVARAGLGFAELDGIATTVGPGGFTGVRIGLATARGLALALNRPAVGVTTTEALALGATGVQERETILTAIDSKRGDLYVQTFAADGAPLCAPAAIDPADLAARLSAFASAPFLVVGDAAWPALDRLRAAGLEGRVSLAPATPSPSAIAERAARRFDAAVAGGGRPEPVYIRPPDAKPPGGRIPGFGP